MKNKKSNIEKKTPKRITDFLARMNKQQTTVKRPLKKTSPKISLNVRIVDFEDYNFPEDKYHNTILLPSTIYTLIIDYPLENPASFAIRGKMTWAQLIEQVVDFYHEVYNTSDKYNVWGHGIGDLFIEEIKVNQTTKKITLEIGS